MSQTPMEKVNQEKSRKHLYNKHHEVSIKEINLY